MKIFSLVCTECGQRVSLVESALKQEIALFGVFVAKALPVQSSIKRGDAVLRSRGTRRRFPEMAGSGRALLCAFGFIVLAGKR
jgi:hypothetical protein